MLGQNKQVNSEIGRQEVQEVMNPTLEKCRGNSKEESKGKSQEDRWTTGFEYKIDGWQMGV